MKTFNSSAILILILFSLFISETRAQTIADWQLINWNPAELSQLLEVLHADDEQVLDFEFVPHRAGGRLEGCGYTFRILMNDAPGQSSHPFVAHGEISYFSKLDSVPYLSFQIGLKDIKEHNSRIWQRNRSVHYAYLSFGGSSLAGREYATASGADETHIYRYRDTERDKLATWLSIPETLSINFTREKGTSELKFDLSVLDFRDAWMNHGTCYRELTQIRQ